MKTMIRVKNRWTAKPIIVFIQSPKIIVRTLFFGYGQGQLLELCIINP